MNEFLIYQAEDRRTNPNVFQVHETLRLSQRQLTVQLGKAKRTTCEYIKHTFESAELWETPARKLNRNRQAYCDWSEGEVT